MKRTAADWKNMRKKIIWIIVLAPILVLAGGLSFAVELYFDYLWFEELDKTTVFTTMLFAKSIIGSVTLLVSFLFLHINFIIANRGPGNIEIGIPTSRGHITAYRVMPATVRKITGIIAALTGLIAGITFAAHWERVWRWLHRVEFDAVDEVFSRDISFYFFSLPFLNDALRLGLLLSVAALTVSAVLYYFKGILTWRKRENTPGSAWVKTHLCFLTALVFLFLSASAYLARYELLFGTHNVFSGASHTDLHGRLPLLTALAAAALIGSMLWVVNAFSAGNKSGMAAVALYVVVFAAGAAYPALIQKFVVAPNELSREAPQIEKNIRATLKSYALDDVDERNLTGDQALTARDIEANAATIRGIRLWDHGQLLDALKQIQEIRTYYDFVSAHNDRYVIDGQLRQFMLSVRELNSASLPERNWINEHLSYTHGYGAAIGPVNRMTPEGLPVLYVKDIPPVASHELLRIERPEIYYGELTDGYALVKTGQEEFNYPSGETNVYTTYAGDGGVPVRSFFRKILFAVYFRDINIAISPLLTGESRFLYYRDIERRMRRVAPFLALDRNPYMVVSEGRLFWIQDAYTTSNRYPYATATPGVGNYIRNSVKIVVDAYNGKVDLFVADPADPVIRVYQKIFPGIFLPLSEMPADLRNHIRYPEDIFQIQTYIYSSYHMKSARIFYNKEDLWEIPTIPTGQGDTPMMPYYTIMRLPREKEEEFILMLPFTPGRKDNLSAWMVARSDGEHYGRLVVYRFPKQRLVFGPRQVIARVNQDAEISRQISLWDQRGSQVIQGNLLVIPIEESLLYVRPLYLRAADGKIPELKRVIVAYENRIAMEETLEESLARLFEDELTFRTADSSPLNEPSPAGDDRGLIERASEAYDNAIRAQRQGDWAVYGAEIDKLGIILRELRNNEDSRDIR
ncbi:MAG TPA: UPF0182 family protein [Acidobacteriota bacterium]|nr:UPF0182 family protein [Acidobacteriota bacterium]